MHNTNGCKKKNDPGFRVVSFLAFFMFPFLYNFFSLGVCEYDLGCNLRRIQPGPGFCTSHRMGEQRTPIHWLTNDQRPPTHHDRTPTHHHQNPFSTPLHRAKNHPPKWFSRRNSRVNSAPKSTAPKTQSRNTSTHIFPNSASPARSQVSQTNKPTRRTSSAPSGPSSNVVNQVNLVFARRLFLALLCAMNAPTGTWLLV